MPITINIPTPRELWWRYKFRRFSRWVRRKQEELGIPKENRAAPVDVLLVHNREEISEHAALSIDWDGIAKCWSGGVVTVSKKED